MDNELAERTRLELATPGVTGRYSNQLNYRSAAEGANYSTTPRQVQEKARVPRKKNCLVNKH